MPASRYESFLDTWGGICLAIGTLVLQTASELELDGSNRILVVAVTGIGLAVTIVDHRTIEFTVDRHVGRIGLLSFGLCYASTFGLVQSTGGVTVVQIVGLWTAAVGTSYVVSEIVL